MLYEEENEYMAAKDFNVLADEILERVGGGSNITYLAHCMTRLRMTVKDKDSVDVEGIKALDGVIGTQWSGEQFQIIIGQKVPDLYAIVRKKGGLENLDPEASEKGETKVSLTPKAIGGQIIDGLSGSLAPLIPLLIAGGMLKLVVVLASQAGWMDAASNTGAILTFWGDAAFYFLPVFVGGFAAKKFGANVGLGMMLGAALIYPDFVAMVGEGTQMTLFRVPVYSAAYTSTILPSILCVWVMSKVQKFFAKYSPAALRAMLEPFLTMLVMVPLSMWILAPAATMVGNVIGVGLHWLTGTFGFVGMAIIGALWPVLIVAGMHVGLLPFVLQQLSSSGFMTINIPNFTNNFAQGAACAGVALRTKDENQRAEAITCAVTAVTGGISEPAIFGICLQEKTPLIASMIGNAVGGAIIGLTGCKMFFFTAAGGVLGLPAFMGESAANLVYFLVASLATMVVTFLMTMILFKPAEKENVQTSFGTSEKQAAAKDARTLMDGELAAPMQGKLLALSETPDEAFASGAMGEGIAIDPAEGRVYAPCDGEISTFFPTGHAVGITADNGAELLIHVGMNTVELDGKGFTPRKQQGDRIKKGELLLEFDLQAIREAGYPVITPVLVTNSDDFKSVEPAAPGSVSVGDVVIHLA